MNHYLSIEERESILFMRGEGKGIRAIATALGRSASTISRELKRNQTKNKYSPSQAEKSIGVEESVVVERRYWHILTQRPL